MHFTALVEFAVFLQFVAQEKLFPTIDATELWLFVINQMGLEVSRCAENLRAKIASDFLPQPVVVVDVIAKTNSLAEPLVTLRARIFPFSFVDISDVSLEGFAQRETFPTKAFMWSQARMFVLDVNFKSHCRRQNGWTKSASKAVFKLLWNVDVFEMTSNLIFPVTRERAQIALKFLYHQMFLSYVER